MFKSTFFTIMIILTLLTLGTTIAFQTLEMNEYNLFETLQTRFGGGK